MVVRSFLVYMLNIQNPNWQGSITYRGESKVAALNMLQIHNDSGSTYNFSVHTNFGSSPEAHDYELIKKILIGEEQPFDQVTII